MSSNRILSRLSRNDFALLEPHLEAVDLPVRKPPRSRKKRIDHVYFIEAGFASVVANGTSKPSIEVGIIGREGMTGLAVVLGHDRAQHATYIQARRQGSAHQCRQVAGGRRTQQHASSRDAALRACFPDADHHNRAGQRPQQDRGAIGALAPDGATTASTARLPLTHEFLSLMLGVRRSGVTLPCRRWSESVSFPGRGETSLSSIAKDWRTSQTEPT